MFLRRYAPSLLVTACLAAVIVPLPAEAEVVVGSGRSASLMTLSSIDQGCHWLGPVSISLVEAPRGGSIAVSQTRAYPNFYAFNTRSRCNTRKLPATRVTYQAAAGFLGIDVVVLEAVFPGGSAKRIRVPISVRPVLQQGPDVSFSDGEAPTRARRPKPLVRHAHHEAPRIKAHAGKPPAQPAPLLTPI